MATDQFGNYVADIEPPVAPYPASQRCCLHGDGPPDASLGSDGKTYTDDLTGNFYHKANGVWTLIGGPGAEIEQVYENRDPAAPDDPSKAAISFPTGGGTMTQWSVADQAWV